MTNPLPLFGQTLDLGSPVDLWKWNTFHALVVSGITSNAAILIVLTCGMVTAVVWRRRLATASRPLMLGCLALIVRQLVAPLSFWVWAILDPGPSNPNMPADARTIIWTTCAVGWPLEVAGVWLLAKAVLVGRYGRAEPEGVT